MDTQSQHAPAAKPIVITEQATKPEKLVNLLIA
jgi:hypothetical protein